MSVIKILLADDQGVTRVVDPRRLAPGAIARIEAMPNARYILVDAETGKAPLEAVVRRHGDDLWIGADGDASPPIQIADYYGSGGSLLAESADGQYYSYDGASIGVSTLADDAVATLALPGATAPEAAAGNAAGGPDWTPLGIGALGLAAVAAGVAVASSGSSNSVRSIPHDAAARDDMAGAPVIRYLLADAEGGGHIESTGMTNDPRPSLVGRGNTPGDAILVYVDGGLAGATTVAPDGSWSFPIPAEQPLTAGEHSLSAIEVAENGKGGPASDPFAVVIGPAVPSRPLFDWVIDDVEPSIGIVNRGESTNDATPTLKGRGEIGTVVLAYDNGAAEPIGSTRIDASGTWTIAIASPLADGDHHFSVVSVNRLGNSSAPSRDYLVTIDTTPPPRPVIEAVHDDVGPLTGLVPDHGMTDDASPTLSGKAEAGAIVVVRDGLDVIGSSVADGEGNWSFTPGSALAEAEHVFTVIARDAAGNSSIPSEPHTIRIDVSGPGTVMIVRVIDDVEPHTGDVPSGGVTNDPLPAMEGIAKPHARVTIRDGSTVLGSTDADEQGNWRFVPDAGHRLAEGAHTLLAQSTDPLGQQSEPSAPYYLVVDTVPPGQPTIDLVFDDVGKEQGALASHDFTDDATPTLHGRAEVGAKVEIYDGGLLIGTTMANRGGRWSFTPSRPLDDGAHALTAKARDGAGNLSVESDAFVVNVDTTGWHKPPPPAILEVIDDVGQETGPLKPYDRTDDAQPVIKGSASPHGVVFVFDNVLGVTLQLGSTRADADGNWQFEPAPPVAPLVDGEHRLQVIVRDSSGSISAASEAFPFTVLVGGVASAAAITGVLDAKLPGSGNVPHQGVTADENPTLMGTARPGSVVHVYLDGNEFARVTADETGRWWFRSDSALAHGEHRFTAAAENGDGTLGARTGEFLVDIDVVAPLPSTGMSLRDNVGSARGAIADGGRTDDATPVYSGHAEPGALVKVLDGDEVLGQTRVQPDGTWTFRPLAPLADGAHSLSTVVVDEAGNSSPRSEAIDFRVDTSAAHSLPGMIALHQVLGHGDLLQSGQSTSDVTPEIRGRATPDSLVTVYADGVPCGSVLAGSDGGWSLSLSNPLADGTHRITASSGTSRHSWAFDLVVDTEPPETATNLKVFGHQSNGLEPGMITTNTMERFTGNAEAGATITVYDYDRVIGSTTVSEYGMWSFTPTQPFSLGRHSLTAVVTDQAGNSSAHSEPGEFQVRALREGENAAWIDGAEWQGGELHYWDWAYGRVTLKGQSTSDTVTLYTEGQFDGRGWIEQGTYHVDRDADGRFSFDVGFNRLFSRLRQPQSFRLAVAGDPPSLQTFKLISAVFPPSLLGGETFLTDNVGTSRGHIRPDGVTDDAMPIYQGRGENLTPFAKEAALVTIYDGDQVIGHTRVKLDRTWTFRPDAPLADGPHSFSATLSDPAGNTTERSPALDFTVDTRSFGGSGGGDPGGVLAIQSVIDHEGVLVGALQPGQATDERSPEIAGVALANSLVKVRVDGKQVGSVLADADGHWSLILPVALSEGRHNVTASSVGLDGKTVTTAPFSLVIDLTPPGRPTIDSAMDDVGPIQRPTSSGSRIDDKTPGFTGRAEPGSLVIVRDGDTVLGSTLADAAGKWIFTSIVRLFDGEHVFTVVAQDAAGHLSEPSDGFRLIIDTEAPQPPAITMVMDDVGSLVGNIMESGVTDDTKPMFGGVSEPFSIVTLEALIDGERIVLGSAQADAQGAWSVVPDEDMDSGVYEVRATAADIAGNVSEPSEPYTLRIDTSLPREPLIIDVIDDVGAETGPLNRDGSSVTDDARPLIKGIADADALVYLYDRVGTMVARVGSTRADAHGDWSFEPAGDLLDGRHEITARVVGVTGVLSNPSEPFRFKVDTTVPPPPPEPAITAIHDDAHHIVAPNGSTDALRPHIVGTAAVGYLVYLYENAQDLIGSVRADGHGRWSYVPDHDLDEGVHAFSVIAEGPNGEMLGPSNMYVIEIEDAWYRLDTLFASPPIDDAATDAAMHATAREVPPERHVADAASAAHEAPAVAGAPATSARLHGEDAPDVGRPGSQAIGEAVQPEAQVSPHVRDAADGVEPAWLGEAAHADQSDQSDALKLSLSDLLQDGSPDLFPANGGLEKPATGAADLPGLTSDLSDTRTSNDAAGAGMPHLSHDNGMPQLDWSVLHGIDIHPT
ncbi:Ig-like domain-containing protein [Burkholderia gladioli]|uniref:Ig-like domain-containing protein n=1 Tax=Burkholderia gladioli TaxID=28095 RepID=UPI00264E8220|nr:Ig-like domain-containing protein [Burkholderia gladioli]MDN7807915.1 Ig-like domain-containing protein [Burkholderia gladioli]